MSGQCFQQSPSCPLWSSRHWSLPPWSLWDNPGQSSATSLQWRWCSARTALTLSHSRALPSSLLKLLICLWVPSDSCYSKKWIDPGLAHSCRGRVFWGHSQRTVSQTAQILKCLCYSFYQGKGTWHCQLLWTGRRPLIHLLLERWRHSFFFSH